MKLIAFASTKGGVAKSTSAIHFSEWLAQRGENVVLVDSDRERNRTSLQWFTRSQNHSSYSPKFDVVSLAKMSRAIAGKDWIVFDCSAAIEDADLGDLADDCNLIVIPAKPDADSVSAAALTAERLKDSKAGYRILLTDCPPKPSKAGPEAQADLEGDGYQVVSQRIRRGEGIRHAAIAGTTVAQQPTKYQGPWWDYKAAFEEILEAVGE